MSKNVCVLMRGKLDPDGLLNLEWIANKAAGNPHAAGGGGGGGRNHKQDAIMTLMAGAQPTAGPGPSDVFGNMRTGSKRCWTARRQGSDLVVRARLFTYSEADGDFTRLDMDYPLVFALASSSV